MWPPQGCLSSDWSGLFQAVLLAAVLCVAAADDDTPVRPVTLGARPPVPAAVHAPSSSYTAYPTGGYRRAAVYRAPDTEYGRPDAARRGYASRYQEPRYYQPRPYAFAYGVNDEHGSGAVFSRSEESDGVTTRGRYSVRLPDGCVQTVTYWADRTGYHPTVQYDCAQKQRPAPARYYRPVYYRVDDDQRPYRRPHSHHDD